MIKNQQSTAVLTPDLIHPNFFKKKGTNHTKPLRVERNLAPIGKHEVLARIRWCERQLKTIGEFGAVLGEVM